MRNLFNGFVRAANGQIELTTDHSRVISSVLEILLAEISPVILPIIRKIDEDYGVNFIWALGGPFLGNHWSLTVSHESGHVEIVVNNGKWPYTCTVQDLNIPIAIEAINDTMFLDGNDDQWTFHNGFWVLCNELPQKRWVIRCNTVMFYKYTTAKSVYAFDGAISGVALRYVLLVDGRLYGIANERAELIDFKGFKNEPSRKQPAYGL